MKNILFLCLISTSCLFAQRNIDEKINLNGAREIQLNFEYADVELYESQEDHIKITGLVSVNLNLDNHAFTVKAENPNKDLLIIHTFIQKENLPKRVIIDTPDGNRKIISNDQLENGKIYQNVSWGTEVTAKLKIEVPKGVKIISNSTYGNIVVSPIKNLEMVNATYGSITAYTVNHPLKYDLHFVSTYGFVDVSIPKKTAAIVKAKVNFGEMFTDLDFDGINNSTKDNQCSSGSSFQGTLNNGTKKLTVESSYGNLFLRKDVGKNDTGRIKRLINRF